MAEAGVHRILLFVISVTKCLVATKLLADLKKCGDLECETLISRVSSMKDYRGPDCRYLNFSKGEEISVYVKLAGEREDLWAGSKGKDFGYFPRDAVQIEEVFITEEIQISATESDFLCLGVSYTFENEDSELNSNNGEHIYSYEEDKDQKSSIYENDFQIEHGLYATSESTLFEDQFPSSEVFKDVRITSESKDWEEIEAGGVEQDHIPEVDHVSPSSAVPEVRGWFGLGGEQVEARAFELVIEPVQESSLQSRKIAVEDENDLKELNNGEPQTEHKQEPESQFDLVPEKQSEASKSEHLLQPQASGWFGGGFTSYLGFGDKDTGHELLFKENDTPLQDVPNSVSPDEEATEILTEKEDIITNDSSVLKLSWFDFGFGMLGFAYVNEDKIISDDGKTEDGGGDKHKHPSVGAFDPDKKQEIKMMKITETEHQIDKKRVLKKTHYSETLAYFKKFLHKFDNPWSFQNIPKEAELPFPKQILDQNNVVENDETEEFSVENYPTDNMKVMSLKSRHSQSGMVSKIELPMKIHGEVHFKTLSSESNDEKSNSSVDTEGPPQMKTDRSTENTLLTIPQKEAASEFQILKYLFQIDVYDFMNSVFSPIVILTGRVSWPFKSFTIILPILLNTGVAAKFV
ncbi:PREDICTED: melanoma inhibitory activity protein 2 [Galeopterus variegatus]|uniref:Melanoma inhibitory activity protein 2 n=1 Tax=Galeopterus variegatus TaxID=482537 RepID=A0ABM0RPL4_GALVR|nr:PREDICTED: melanoma inhibitory activity protein 2 [Galeopterus variegatus]